MGCRAGGGTPVGTGKGEVIEIAGVSFAGAGTKSTREKTGFKGFPGLNWGMLRGPVFPQPVQNCSPLKPAKPVYQTVMGSK